MSALQFDLSEQREKELASFERRIEPAHLQSMVAGSATLTRPVTLTLNASRQGAQVLFHGAAEGEWEVTCVRCLGAARQSFRAAVEGEAPLSGDTFDASESVREALELALPLSAHCRPDCKGLCAQCGANRNERDCGCKPPQFNLRRKDA
jgi:uncharacterized metal-binding protein YceD (DUF177 family)